MASAALHPGINPLQAFPSLIADMDRLSAGIVVAGLAASLFGTISAVSICAATLLMKDFFEPLFNKIGRASCRGRVCQYVSILVVAVSLQKKQIYYRMTNISYSVSPSYIY